MSDLHWPTGMMVIQGNHLEQLRDVMSGWIQRYPLRPLEQEQILVQSNGIAQWLKMALAQASGSGGCGIAAAVDVQLPSRFLWQAYRCFEPDIPAMSPFDKGPLTWTLYQLLSDREALTEAVPQAESLSPLLGFLQKDADPRRSYQLAARLADLYDQYQVYRADWLDAWEQNRDVLIKADSGVVDLPVEQRWQPALWRLIGRTIVRRPMDFALNERENIWRRKSRAEVHRAVVRQCRHLQGAPDELPRRVIVFGISALPQQTLELLQALSRFCQVLLFVHNPSPHYWGDLIEGKQLLKQYTRTRQRKLPENLPLESLHLQGNPLLASWGKQGRDYLHLLDENDQPDRYRGHFHSIDLFEPPTVAAGGPGRPLLQQVQDDIYELRSLDERRQLSGEPDWHIDPSRDRSLQFLVAHSPQREVEILHDYLLDALEHANRLEKPLQPRDILVMVPDVSVYAPHIQAVFGRYTARHERDREDQPGDPRYIPFHISDQQQRGVNSLITAFERLLAISDARFAVSELLDLLETPSLRSRFGLAEEQLATLHQWIKGANIRWGLDQSHREELELAEAGEQNTWLFGLRRMLLGYAAGEHGHWQGIEAYDEVAGLEAALVGPLVLLIEELRQARLELIQPHPPREWEACVNALCQRFFNACDASDEKALDSISRALDTWCEECELGQLPEGPLPLEVFREEILSRLDQPTLSQKFLGGAVNFATLMPMRAIPFKQIWLLGMNDTDYPRSQPPADFDLMATDYRPGDRSRREDDRYLFLEAMLSARERLVISWVGRSIRDNSAKPPSVLVGQLRDYLRAGWRLAGDPGGDLLGAITTEHPLQPFSPQYFTPAVGPADQTGKQALFTYAREWRQVHEPPPAAGFDDAPLLRGESQLPPLSLEAPLTLKDLADFLRRPLHTFYRHRLGVGWFEEGETTEDAEIFALDHLDRWTLHQRIIDQVSQQQALCAPPETDLEPVLDSALARLQGAGELPLQAFAGAARQQLQASLTTPLRLGQQLREAHPRQCSTRVHLLELTGGAQIEAQLTDLWSTADGTATTRLILQPSRLTAGEDLKYYHLVRYWPEHLCAQLDRPVTTWLLGPESEQPVRLPPLPAEQATALLTDIGNAWLEYMQQLWPLACKTALSLLADTQPAAVYEGTYHSSGEISEHPAFARFWPDFHALAADGRLERLAHRLYAPMLACLNATRAREDQHG